MNISETGVRETLRRVVTGLDDAGRSVIFIDDNGAASSEIGVSGLYEIWSDRGEAMDRRDRTDRGAGDVVLGPEANGVRVRWFCIAPEEAGLSEEDRKREMQAIFAGMHGSEAQMDVSKHPGMHETQTIDVVVIISGTVRLVLENDERVLSAGDIVVQRGTNHAWEVVGDQPLVALAVLIHREFVG